MAKKLIAVLALLILFSVLAPGILAAETHEQGEVHIYFFWAEGCPHCAHEEVFLEKLEAKYPNLEVHNLEVSKSRENIELLIKTADRLNADGSNVPFTVIGDKYFVGWYNEEVSGKPIEDAVILAQEIGCQNVVEDILSCEIADKTPDEKEIPKTIHLPLLGEIETSSVSLPLLTVIIGALDGFNPCAMWVLLFLITLLLGIDNIRKRWIFGTIFIVASAFVYFLFMTAWLNLFLFLGFVFFVRLAIGIVALMAGGYNLREYFTNRGGTCKVTKSEKRRKIFDSLKKVVH